MSPYIRTVTTASGATAVQVVLEERAGKKAMKHIGSAHDDYELALLKAEAQRVIDGDQLCLDLGLDDRNAPAGSGSKDNPLPVSSQKAGVLLECIDSCYQRLGFDVATGGDQVFANLVRARIIQPGSKLDSIETLAEVGVVSATYATIKRHLASYATESFREILSQALARHAGIGAGSFVLYDVTTLYFETDTPDDLRKSGFSKERRVEPQILVGLLTDATGFPLHIGAYEGNKAETHTLLPMIRAFQSAYNLDRVTIVADAGMFSAENKTAIVEAGLDYILSTKVPSLPEVITQWKQEHPGQDYTHGQIWSQPSYTDRRHATTGKPDSVTHFHYSYDRARRTVRGIDEQLAKAARAVEGKVAIKRNRYIDLKAPNKKVNYELATKHRALAGIKGYETTLTSMPAPEVLRAYRHLLNIEKSFRMSKSDLKARPIYARTEDSINAHLNIVMAALAISQMMETATGKSIKRLVRTLKKYRTFELKLNGTTIHAATPLPPDVQQLLNAITQA
ncbi:IS1634 family transposase [Corynebacterium lizhenjunii]|uniref:IS1634 family transposase n=1 Tax=Corynebacterium lizhenjunii TaxID=2709394 RepID=UPI003CC819B5